MFHITNPHQKGGGFRLRPLGCCMVSFLSPSLNYWLNTWGQGGGLARGHGFGLFAFGKAMVFVCLPLAVPIGLSPLHILTLCGSRRVLLVSTEPLDDLSCLTTAPRDGLLPVPLTRCIQMHTPSPCRLQY